MYNLCLLFHTGLSDMHNYFAVGKEFVSLESLGKLKQLWAAVSTHSDLDVRKDGHIDVCACVCGSPVCLEIGHVFAQVSKPVEQQHVL